MSTYTISGDEPFDPKSFWQSMSDVAARAGKQVMEKALVAYYVAIDSQTPPWARAQLAGALVYLGFPIDAVPDYLPAVGYADDLSILAMALVAVAASIRWRHVRQARSTLRTWGFKVNDTDARLNDDDPAIGFND